MTPAVFWRLSMREWLLMQRGFFNKVEEEYKVRWEIARWQTYILAIPNAKKGALNKPEDLVRFPRDAPKEDPVMGEQELARWVKKMGGKIEDGKFVN